MLFWLLVGVLILSTLFSAGLVVLPSASRMRFAFLFCFCHSAYLLALVYFQFVAHGVSLLLLISSLFFFLWSWQRLIAPLLISLRASRSWCQGITLSILVLALWSFFCLSTFLFSSCPFSAPPFPVMVPTFHLSSFAFFML